MAWLASRIYLSLWVRSPHLLVFAWLNSDFWTRITSLYGFQTSPVVLCIQNRDFSNEDYKSLWVPDITCGFVHSKQRVYAQELHSVCGSQPSSCGFGACKTTCLASRNTTLNGSQPSSCGFVLAKQRLIRTSELQVSMCPRAHPDVLWMQNGVISIQNYLSLWVPALICGFCMKNSDFWTTITSLYGFQDHHLWFCAFKTAWIYRQN